MSDDALDRQVVAYLLESSDADLISLMGRLNRSRHAAQVRAEQAEAELAQIAAAAERRRQDIHEYLTAQMKATGDKDYDAAQ